MPDSPVTHRKLAELEAGFATLPAAPRDVGRVALIVRRPQPEKRDTPRSVRLSASAGVEGDDWSRRPPRDPEAQVTLMRRDIAELIAPDRPLPLFGDNLLVDFDLSAAHLPTGTRLRLGDAIVEVTPLPHDGCRKFAERFGLDALRFVQAKPTRGENLRGIHVRVIEDGDVAVGAAIQMVSTS